METLSYLLQVNLFLVLCFALYRLLLRTETFHQLNRSYLLLSAAVSLLLPLWQSAWVQSWFITEQVEATWHVIALPAITVMSPAATTTPDALQWPDIVGGIYWVGVGLMLLRLAARLYFTHRHLQGNDLPQVAFSFFHRIYIAPDLPEPDTIYAHEHTHSQQWHSADTIFFEVLAIFCWFNPVVYAYQRCIAQLHEFIADEVASREMPTKADYAVLLVSQQFGTTPRQLLGHSFHKSTTIKQRIQMLMKQRSRKTALVKYGFIVPLFLVLLSVASAQMPPPPPPPPATQAPPPPPPPLAISIKSKADTAKVWYKKDVEMFNTVQEKPEFPGGLEAMYKYFGENIKYPAEAKEKGVQGKVFVKMVISDEGYITEATVLKGIGAGCDQEAIRVVASMPKWKPGMQNGKAVNVYYTLPIKFALDE